MVKVSVLYPKASDTKFDMAYYINRHIAMVRQLLGSSLKGVSVKGGITSLNPGSDPPYIALGHLLFESLQDFQSSFGPHAAVIVADIPNYTNSQPVVQISEVKFQS